MKAKKKDPIYVDKDKLDEVVVTPYTKNKYALEERLSNKSTGGLKPSYPIFDALLGRALLKNAKGVMPLVKKISGKAKKTAKYRGTQAALAAKDVNEYTNQ